MSQCDGMGKILIGPDILGYAAGYLSGLKRMRQPGSVVVSLIICKYLSFILESPECLRMYYSVPVPLE